MWIATLNNILEQDQKLQQHSIGAPNENIVQNHINIVLLNVL